MGNNPLEIATYLFEFTCEFREILNNQCRIISANSVREFTFDDWHVNWPLNICSSHFCPAFLAMVFGHQRQITSLSETVLIQTQPARSGQQIIFFQDYIRQQIIYFKLYSKETSLII